MYRHGYVGQFCCWVGAFKQGVTRSLVRGRRQQQIRTSQTQPSKPTPHRDCMFMPHSDTEKLPVSRLEELWYPNQEPDAGIPILIVRSRPHLTHPEPSTQPYPSSITSTHGLCHSPALSLFQTTVPPCRRSSKALPTAYTPPLIRCILLRHPIPAPNPQPSSMISRLYI